MYYYMSVWACTVFFCIASNPRTLFIWSLHHRAPFGCLIHSRITSLDSRFPVMTKSLMDMMIGVWQVIATPLSAWGNPISMLIVREIRFDTLWDSSCFPSFIVNHLVSLPLCITPLRIPLDTPIETQGGSLHIKMELGVITLVISFPPITLMSSVFSHAGHTLCLCTRKLTIILCWY